MSNDRLALLFLCLGFGLAVSLALGTGFLVSALGGGAWWLLVVPVGAVAWRLFVGC